MTIRAGHKLKLLLNRVARAAALHGKKSELAKFLGVPRPRISNWLSQDRAPNGEVTLRMLEWVQAEEANQTKSPGSASTQPEPRTQHRRSANENQTSSPKRKR
ncbi:hypothetical protein SBV1_3750003 [Verrucomicrobia bacterium]|nr:hypothetical protein SBV1_3750003 [Verrucomicrobiota bacterium]